MTIKKKIREGLGNMFDGSVGAYKIAKDIAGEKDKVGDRLMKFSDKPNKIGQEIEKLKVKMKKLSSDLEFEEAAKIRDEIKRLQILELQIRDGDTSKESKIVQDGEGK